MGPDLVWNEFKSKFTTRKVLEEQDEEGAVSLVGLGSLKWERIYSLLLIHAMRHHHGIYGISRCR